MTNQVEETGSQGLNPHLVVRITAVATAILILAGALVTSTDSGLSVPDWPLSFGTLFPSMAEVGVRFEHTHRLIAGSIGLLTFFMAASVWRGTSALLPRILAGCAVGAVLLQALLGGMTVLLKLPTAVSAAHGTLGQTFFCLVVALALVTSPSWRETRPREAGPGAGGLVVVTTLTTVMVWIQLLIAAVMRHHTVMEHKMAGPLIKKAGLAIPTFPLSFGQWIPPIWDPLIALHFAHRVVALVIFLLAATCVFMALRRTDDEGRLRGPAIRLALLVMLQVTLGAFVVWTGRHPLVTSIHVANGALVLVTSLVLTLWTRRLWNQRGTTGVC